MFWTLVFGYLVDFLRSGGLFDVEFAACWQEPWKQAPQMHRRIPLFPLPLLPSGSNPPLQLPRLPCSNSTRGSLRCKSPPPVADWIRSAAQAPPTRPKLLPAPPVKFHDNCRPQLRGPVRCHPRRRARLANASARRRRESSRASPQWSRCRRRSAPNPVNAPWRRPIVQPLPDLAGQRSAHAPPALATPLFR